MKSVMQEDITKVVDETLKLYIQLHGLGVNLESITEAISSRYGYNLEEVSSEVSYRYSLNYIAPEYGVFIGRCQPFHLGHQAVVNEIMLDGRRPIIILGSIDKRNEQNPLSFGERKQLIELVYPKNEVIILGLEDNENWDIWMNDMIDMLCSGRNKSQITMYYHNKEQDRLDFQYNGVEYKNEFYTKVFELEGLNSKEIEFVDRHDFKIESNGRDIRHNLDGFKHFMDARIYWELKKKGW